MTITPSLLYRLGAVAVVAAFPVNLAGGITHPVVEGAAHSVAALTMPINPLPQYLLLVGTLLQLLGLPAVYAWVSRRAGRLGLVAYAVYMVSSTLVAFMHLAIEAFVAVPFARDPETAHLVSGADTLLDNPAYVALQLGSGLVMMVSMLALGVALIRSRAVPVWIGVTLAAGALVLMLPIPSVPGVAGLVIEIPRGLAFAAIGVHILGALRPGVSTTTPTPDPAAGVPAPR